jgi:hypothetical protein
MQFRKIISLTFMLVLLQTIVFNISALYFYDIETHTLDANHEQCYNFEEYQLPFIFLTQKHTKESVKPDLGSLLTMIFGTFAEKIDLPVFELKQQVESVFTKHNVPLFLIVRSLRY